MEDAKMNNEEDFPEVEDEDEEEYKKDYEKEKFTLENTLNLSSVKSGAHVLVCNPGASSAAAKIFLETDYKDAGEVKA